MAPAFSSTKQAAAFALLLLVLLLLPVVMTKSLLPPRSDIYASLGWRYCAYDFLHRQIFEEKSDVDIAFIGSSRMWAGIDTPQVQAALSKKLGRPAVVLTLAWSWLGFDANYFITQDLLQNRKVRLIVFDDEYRADDVAHVAATHWFRFGDNAAALAGLPLRLQMSYYFASILGMPRNLLSCLRPNLPEARASSENLCAQSSHDRLGAFTNERWMYPGRPFAEFVPQGDARPADVSVYSAATKNQFRFSGPATPPWQLQFAKKFAGLAQAHGTRLVFLHLCPVYSDNETNSPAVQERECWPDVLNSNVTMMGIPPARLYAGIRGEDLPKLFYTPDFYHFNKNGAAFFTRLITPALLQIYEDQANH
jgi:hypothetical protein